VKVPTRPAALKVQVGWKMIEVFDKSTDVYFEFQKAMVDKLLSSRAGNFVDHMMKSLQMKLELHSLKPSLKISMLYACFWRSCQAAGGPLRWSTQQLLLITSRCIFIENMCPIHVSL
jgi:hypothetical protein